jgi:protein-disulfide isomerase
VRTRIPCFHRSLRAIIAALALFAFSGVPVAQSKAPAATGPGASDSRGPAVKDAGSWREELVRKTNAPITIVEFFDYQCPFCARTEPAFNETLKSYRGKVRLVLKNMPLPIHPDSMLAHQAALAAGEQGRFWEMHDLLLAHQRNVKLPDLLNYARELHLDVSQFQSRLESGKFKPVIDRDLAEARSQGVNGTPTFFINGQQIVGAQSQQRLTEVIEELLNPGKTPAAASRSAHPERTIDVSHAPYRGRQDAPVTIVEFSDLQCPFCATVAPTLKALLERNPDQVRWIFKNYPLDFHADAPLAHHALLAAGEQGKFWEMHDLIFGSQRNLKRDRLRELARSLNLDMARFESDLESPGIAQALRSDHQEGDQMSVSGTPSFLINGEMYSGAMRLEQFQSLIDKALARVAATGAKIPGPADSQAGPEISLGLPDSPITLVWYSDLQSSLTLKATFLVRQIMSAHPGKIRLVFRNLPLEIHPEAMRLHEAALAANAQGKFWPMHDLIIANPGKAGRADMLGHARRLGLDLDRFQADLDSAKFQPIIQRDLAKALRHSVLGTPVFFVNSIRVDGLQPEKTFDDIIVSQLAALAKSGTP